jgi:hypothetical protein
MATNRGASNASARPGSDNNFGCVGDSGGLPNMQALLSRQGVQPSANLPPLNQVANGVMDILRRDGQVRNTVLRQLARDEDAEARELSGEIQVIKNELRHSQLLADSMIVSGFSFLENCREPRRESRNFKQLSVIWRA